MSKELDDLNAQLEKEVILDRRKKAVQEKELDLKEKRVDIAFADLVKAKDDTERSKNVGFGKLSDEEISQLLDDNASYLEAAKNPIPFICSEFDSIVPFFRKNLILLMAPTGAGKSTAVCNIAYTALLKQNPITKQGYKILIITNEEAPEDLMNRLTCFSKGWRYSNHDQFNDEQRTEFARFISVFAKKGNVRVVGDRVGNVDGWSTSVEGIVQIFDNLMRDGEHYDLVLIDYFQNIVRSREKPDLNEYEAQRLLANEFDRIKNIFPGVIVVMGQGDPLKDPDDTTPYNLRWKGSKLILTKSTFICEIIPEHKLMRSKWKIHKSRFTDAIGKEVITGFDKGRFVPYSVDFQRKIAKAVADNLEREKEQELGMGYSKKEDESKE